MMNSILITGGAGSFGRAFARALLDHGVERVCIFSRGEHRQAEMRAEFNDDPRLRWLIGDVRDKGRLVTAMEGCDVVVHAAALKRIEVCAYCPIEVVRTNIMGSVNVIEAAHEAGVGNVVALSTDKAWQPISAYGQSKALMESLFLAANHSYGDHGPRYCVTRYGNVWWSTGSVGPTWQDMVDRGDQWVPCTDPDCTRFFMTMDEAVDLVMDTVAGMERGGPEANGDLIIPMSLPAYRLGDLAEAFGVATNVTGLPAHEKKHEGLMDGLTSDKARRMTVQELREAIASVR